MTQIYVVLAFLGLRLQPMPVYVRVRQAEVPAVLADLSLLPAMR